MTPKEKAKNLFDLHFEYVQAITSQGQIDNAKECALITVDELIFEAADEDDIKWFKEVKAEIKKIEI